MSSLVPLPGSYGRVDAAIGTGNDLTNEAMSYVSDIECGNPAYTVYEITDESKRYLKTDEVPVFQKKIAGAGEWITITDIREIQYPGGRLVVNTPLGSTDTVQCLSGHYMTVTQIYGTSVTKISDKTTMKDITCIGDSAKMQFPTITEFSISADIFYVGICANKDITMESGTNNSIILVHQPGGISGNDISFEIAPAAGASELLINVTGNDIVVIPASTAVPAITSIANDVIAALNSDASVIRLGIVATAKAGETGLGIVTNYEHTHLAGGLNPADYAATKAAKNPLIITIYSKVSSDIRYEGYVFIESIDSDLAPDDVIKQSITFTGHGKLYLRMR